MNKKFLVGITTVLVSAFAAYGVSRSMNNSNTELSELTLANIEALASSEVNPSNTGPAQIVDCKGWWTGDRKICLSENSNSCTETGCY